MTDYLLRDLSSFLRGRPLGKKKQQVAHFWTGRGANGKSLTTKLMEDAFGNYLRLLDMKYFTSSGKSDAPNSQLYNLQNKRIAYVAEGGEVEVIGRIFKTYSGGDTISARMTHESLHRLYFPASVRMNCLISTGWNVEGDKYSNER